MVLDFNAFLRHDKSIDGLLTELVTHVKGYCLSLTHISPPFESLIDPYHSIIESFSQTRAGSLFFPYLASGLGWGPFVQLADGSVKLDFINGIGVHYAHHTEDLLRERFLSACEDTIMQGNLQQNIRSVELLQSLVSLSSLDHGILTSSGAMAVENALKLVFYHKFPATRLLAFSHCFSGRTLALCQVTDKEKYRPNMPETLSVDYIPFYDETDHQGSIQRTIDALTHHLNSHPDDYAGMIFELIQGEGGYYVGDHDFFKAIIRVLKDHNIAVIIDEIQTFGRTTHPFATHLYGLEKDVDIITIGKLSHVCATLFSHSFSPPPGLISQTFTSSTSAIDMGLFIIKQFESQSFFGDTGLNRQMGAYCRSHLDRLSEKYPHLICGPYGLDSMVAFTVFNGDVPLTTRFLQSLFSAGVIAFINGNSPLRIRFLLPVGVLTHEHIDQAMTVVEQVLCGIADEEGL